MAPSLSLPVKPQLLANPGLAVLADVAKEPHRWAIESKVGSKGLVVKDRHAPYRGGSRSGWFKVKDRNWYEREVRLQP